MKRFIEFCLLISLLSCTNARIHDELGQVTMALNEANELIDKLKLQIEDEGDLVHMVFLKTKPDIDQKLLYSELKKLAQIEGLLDFQVGPYQDLGDRRAMTDFNLMMEMSFKDIEAYKAYQIDSIHLEQKSKLADFLAGPPATFHYWKQ